MIEMITEIHLSHVGSVGSHFEPGTRSTDVRLFPNSYKYGTVNHRPRVLACGMYYLPAECAVCLLDGVLSRLEPLQGSCAGVCRQENCLSWPVTDHDTSASFVSEGILMIGMETRCD